MSLLSRLERRFGRFAIPHLTEILIAGQAALYLASQMPQGITIDRILLIPPLVLSGEVWRLVTFLFTPPTTGPLFVIFYFILLHMFGTTLENHWGTFRYNMFLLVGYLANVAAAFLASALLGSLGPAAPADGIALAPLPASSAFLYSSLFLAFARLYPDRIINLFFILPIRIKWLALLMWVGYGYEIVTGSTMSRLLVLATVLNYLLFFGPEHWRELKHGHRRRSFQAKAKKSTAVPTHVCRICGANSDASPRLAFRYCSKCAGQACYCPDHIRDHVHVTAETPASA